MLSDVHFDLSQFGLQGIPFDGIFDSSSSIIYYDTQQECPFVLVRTTIVHSMLIVRIYVCRDLDFLFLLFSLYSVNKVL